MKAEHWIISAGIIFAFAVFGAAMVPGLFGSGDGSVVSTSQSAKKQIARPDTAAMNGIIKAPPVVSTAIPGLIPFSRAKRKRFQGKVVRMISLGSDAGWGQIHIWVDSGPGTSQEISVAPNWYLKHLGCQIMEASQVRGVAFKFGKPDSNSELYAKSITVGGKSCRLRNDEGFALWSNRLR